MCHCEEQEPCEDAISRQAVFDYIRDNYRRWFINDDAFMQCVNGIKDIISVTPQPKTGHWIKDEITERARVEYKHKCNLCGAYHRAMYNYCPSCGAKMH